jgi:serine/threonine-protein kinase
VSGAAGDWSRVKDLFARALDEPPASRDDWVTTQCGSDQALLRELRSLLAAHAAPDTHRLGAVIAPLLSPLLAEDDDALIDTRVGPYRILRLLGEGGMGRVFLAERADGQFRQNVALKLLRSGFESTEMHERFLREREVLARLSHPNIAPLHDGGVGAGGTPYFTLEYVAGDPITLWCDRHRLGLAARLKLLLKVCEAVQYAHRNLIVHRDLKPSNIFVSADGEPKLLDFGIAKSLDPGGDRGITQTRSQPMTREYAAPEQVLGEPITTATDVYALGVLMYELLSGRLPYARAERGESSWAKAIVEEVPEPFTRALDRPTIRGEDEPASPDAASARGTTLAFMRRTLRGDLDRIARRALEKAPEARYGSVGAFAEDLRAWLYGRALPGGSRRYRIAKYVRRHRFGAAMAALVFVLVVAGVGAVLYEARETARQAQAVSAVKDFLLGLFTAGSPNEAKGRDIGVRELLERGRTQVDHNLATQPGVRAELQGVLGRIYFQLGLYEPKACSAMRSPRRRRSAIRHCAAPCSGNSPKRSLRAATSPRPSHWPPTRATHSRPPARMQPSKSAPGSCARRSRSAAAIGRKPSSSRYAPSNARAIRKSRRSCWAMR